MGALTIKNYYYESRPWELLRVCVPNLLTSYPSYVLLCFKNEFLLKILPWNRNEFISNKLRFALDFFSNIFDFNEEKSLKDDLLQILISYILMLQYIYDSFSSRFKMFTHFKNYKFNLSSNFFVIHNYLNLKIFNFKLKDYKLLQFSNLNFLNFSHFVFLTNFNDCLIDSFTHICIDQNNMLKFTDFYYYLYNNNLVSSNKNILDDEQIIEEQYNDKFSI